MFMRKSDSDSSVYKKIPHYFLKDVGWRGLIFPARLAIEKKRSLSRSHHDRHSRSWCGWGLNDPRGIDTKALVLESDSVVIFSGIDRN
jgi:hypothetical protein